MPCIGATMENGGLKLSYFHSKLRTFAIVDVDRHQIESVFIEGAPYFNEPVRNILMNVNPWSLDHNKKASLKYVVQL